MSIQKLENRLIYLLKKWYKTGHMSDEILVERVVNIQNDGTDITWEFSTSPFTRGTYIDRNNHDAIYELECQLVLDDVGWICQYLVTFTCDFEPVLLFLNDTDQITPESIETRKRVLRLKKDGITYEDIFAMMET